MAAFERRTPGKDEGSDPSHGPILVAIGPSGGVSALECARAIAAREANELIVLSVVEPPPIYTFETNRALLLPWLVDQQISERREMIRDRVRSLGIRGPFGDAIVEAVYGEPAFEIARAARLRGARLIVLGIGPHALRHRLIASGTAASTSRQAPCPVLAVAEHARPLPRIAVVATDFSAESVYAAQVARSIVGDGATLHLVHAWSRYEVAFPNLALATLNEDYERSLPERFAHVRSAIEADHTVSIDTLALLGNPAEVVIAVAKAKRADLIVAATHSRGALQRWLLGSTSSALLRGAECSVLLVPEPPVARRRSLERQTTGTSVTSTPAEWNDELQGFVERNRDRRTVLEIDDPSIGAQVQETGYVLVGAAYDQHDGRVTLMFGGMQAGGAHLTRSLGSVRSLAVHADQNDTDEALFIESGEGSALLTFQRAPSGASVNA